MIKSLCFFLYLCNTKLESNLTFCYFLKKVHNMENKKEFKPYIPAEKITPELTLTSIIVGVILAVIFGAANAYLGLRVGMTVSASIPAAVIGMGIIRVILRKNSHSFFGLMRAK